MEGQEPIAKTEDGGQKPAGAAAADVKPAGAADVKPDAGSAGGVLGSGAEPEKKPEAGAEKPAGAEEAKPEEIPNILGGGAEPEKKPAAEEAKPEEKPEEVTPEQVAEYAGKIAAVDLGTGPDGTPIAWDAAGVQAVAGVFAKHKVPEAVANEAVAAYAAHMKAQYQESVKAEAQLYKSMAEECTAKFGADLPRVAQAAYRGGVDIFGADLFKQLVGVPAFANDARIIERLAARGRAVTDDPGTEVSGGAGAPPSDLASRLYPPGSLGKK